MKNITVIGSCRIHAPMQALARQSILFLDTRGTRGYVHSLSEITQLIRFLRGYEAISSTTLPFFPLECLQDLHHFGLTFHDNTEAFVIEICSIKEFRMNGQYVQMNLLFEKIRSKGLEKDYFDLCKRINNSPGAFCPFFTSPQMANKEIENLFANLEGISLTQEQVLTKLKELQDLLKRPLAVVTHIELDGHEEDPTVSLYSRRAGIEYLRLAGKQLNIPVIEPGILVKRVGEEILMQQGSTTHYKQEANFVIGRWIFKRISKNYNS